MVSISLEVKGDVGSGTRPEGGKGYVGGLDEGYGVPDVSCGGGKNPNINARVFRHRS